MEIDPRIMKIAREVRRDVSKASGLHCPPKGFCSEASLSISSRLSRAGIPHRVVVGEWIGPVESDDDESEEYDWADEDHESYTHIWIEFPQYGNAILDVTADQFADLPPIHFPAPAENYRFVREFDPAVYLSLEPRLRIPLRRREEVNVRRYRRLK